MFGDSGLQGFRVQGFGIRDLGVWGVVGVWGSRGRVRVYDLKTETHIPQLQATCKTKASRISTSPVKPRRTFFLTNHVFVVP